MFEMCVSSATRRSVPFITVKPHLVVYIKTVSHISGDFSFANNFITNAQKEIHHTYVSFIFLVFNIE